MKYGSGAWEGNRRHNKHGGGGDEDGGGDRDGSGGETRVGVPRCDCQGGKQLVVGSDGDRAEQSG